MDWRFGNDMFAEIDIHIPKRSAKEIISSFVMRTSHYADLNPNDTDLQIGFQNG